ncbi:unnamed protein product [Effrenium voratum]|uniref:Glycosyltransferase 2-like domain-containing protein n=1 Tax=Effrenium voratum TaxID=2562239 RepID=A0AA36JHE7_9DINO|nr:unnamed protein product [Effrenium voratum]CAJ1405734.1 unnamed protein product [Effrenium voratum]
MAATNAMPAACNSGVWPAGGSMQMPQMPQMPMRVNGYVNSHNMPGPGSVQIAPARTARVSQPPPVGRVVAHAGPVAAPSASFAAPSSAAPRPGTYIVRHVTGPSPVPKSMWLPPQACVKRDGPIQVRPAMTSPTAMPQSSPTSSLPSASPVLPTPTSIPTPTAFTMPSATSITTPTAFTMPGTSVPSIPVPKSTAPSLGMGHGLSIASVTGSLEEKEKGDSPKEQVQVSSSPLSHKPKVNSTGTPQKAKTPSKRYHIRQDSVQWTQLERDLYEMSSGAYHPTEMAQMRRLPGGVLVGGTGVNFEVPGRVSIVAPSMSNRRHYHENLYRCFDAQKYPDKELIVIETYEDAPSEYLQKKMRVDERVVHITIKVQPGKDFTVGLKRNMTLHMATGEFIVNFDDDDLYAPGYVEKMVGLMQRERLVGVTLSAWYNYYTGKGVCTFSDPESWDEWADDQAELDEILYGYGFSYSHRRQPSLMFSYPNVGFAEDAPFFLKLRDIYGTDKVLLYKDNEGLCVHIMHRANTAQVLGSRTVSAQDIAALSVCDLKPFQRMIDNDFFRFSPWRPPVRLPALSVEINPDHLEVESEDVIPRLRASTLEGPGGFDIFDPPTRPRANTFRNDISCIEL